MPLTQPYGQMNYLGEFSSDALANAFVYSAQWDTNQDGTGIPPEGLTYFNTTTKSMRVFARGAWFSQGGSAAKILTTKFRIDDTLLPDGAQPMVDLAGNVMTYTEDPEF